MPAKAAVPALINVLVDEDGFVRRNAVYALGEIGEPAVPALIKALRDEAELVRSNAAEALHRISTPDAIDALEKDKTQK